MPKPHTFPVIFDDTLQIKIQKLKEWGYLNPGQIKRTRLKWNINDFPTNSISVIINTRTTQPCIILEYKYYDKLRKYKVNLITKPSNLGKGVMWFFVCPDTGKHCRILYLIDGYFLHRTAFTGCLYNSQKRSKKYRNLCNEFGAEFKIDDLCQELYSKNFKRYYAGKPTRRFKDIMNKLKKIEGQDFNLRNYI